MIKDTATLILPSETRAREFDAKLLLACHAAEQGMQAIVGAKKAIDQRAASLPRGIYVGKSLTNRNLIIFRMLRRMGFTVTAWDEEGLVWATPELYRTTKIGAEALNEPVCLFAWGEANANAWREHPEFGGAPIHATGNPRADLLRPELQGYFADNVERLRNQYGDFILINTNFSRLNHYYPGQSRQRKLLQDGGEVIRSNDDPRLGLAAHKKQLFESFLHMLPALAKQFPETNIVLRPHPSENHEIWRQIISDFSNVHVVHQGNVVPWLLAARTTIHNGCTTAVESYLLGRITLAYMPVISEAYDHPLPNGLSIQAYNEQTLFDRVAQTLGHGLQMDTDAVQQTEALARHHVASYNTTASCETITNILADLSRDSDTESPTLVERALGQVTARSRGLVKRIESNLPMHPNNNRYLRHLFPPLTCENVEQQIDRFGSLLNRFRRLNVQELGPNVFMVRSRA
jgi:surface carbohydrate biosynthesis protein